MAKAVRASFGNDRKQDIRAAGARVRNVSDVPAEPNHGGTVADIQFRAVQQLAKRHIAPSQGQCVRVAQVDSEAVAAARDITDPLRGNIQIDDVDPHSTVHEARYGATSNGIIRIQH
jgi:hypothetical protein